MATAETVVLTLQENISGPAAAAGGGLSRLEQQILREQTALERLQSRLEGAQGKLEGIAEGKVDTKAEAAFLRQEAAVDKLEQKLASARAALDTMGGADVPTSQFDAAERAVARLEAQLENAKARLAEMGTPGGPVVNIAEYQRAQGAVDSLLDAVAAKEGRLDELREKLESSGDAAGGAAGKFEQATGETEGAASLNSGALRAMGTEFRSLAGPLGNAGSRVFQFANALRKMPPQVAVAVAAIALLVAAVAAAFAFFAKGISASDAYRNELLKLAGASKGNMAAATELQGAITAVASSSALSRDKVADLAGQLAHAGLSGGELKRALEAAAIASSAGGEQMASDFVKAAEAAHKTGGSVDALSAKMKAELGGVAAAQALSFGVQIDKLKENITGLFSGADITPLLNAMHALLSIFDQTTATGQAMRAAIGSAIESMIGIVLRAATMMVKLYIAVKSNSVVWFLLTSAVKGIAIVFGLIAAAIGIVIAGIGLLVSPIVVLVGAIGSFIGAIVGGISSLFSYLAAVPGRIKSSLSDFSLADVGSQMINGLINGITSAAGAVVNAMKGVVNGAINAAKSSGKLFGSVGAMIMVGQWAPYAQATLMPTKGTGSSLINGDGVGYIVSLGLRYNFGRSSDKIF